MTLERCLGLTAVGGPAVRDAVQELVGSTLQFVRERNPLVDGQPEVARYVADGTFERLVARL